jgi:DNA polymerase-4
MSRVILHSDLNCFYAAVEMMLHPELREKAIAVCGSTESRHGIVLAKSYPAKAKGVRTGMPNWQARQLCPELILVPPHYDQYLKYGKLAREIYQRYTDLVEPYGMDESWLDITRSRCCIQRGGRAIAEEIRKAVREELGLTVSIGVSFNKVFAKLGSDLKKPDAVTEITQENFRETIWPLPAADLLYVGRATDGKLARYGIRTIGDIAALDPAVLKRWLGVNGLVLWRFAAGLDESRVMQKDFVSPIKSVGHGITCYADLNSNEEVWRVMLELSQDVGHRLRVHALAAGGVQVYVRRSDLDGAQFQTRLAAPAQSPLLIARAARTLFETRYDWRTPVRAVCVRAIDLVPQTTPQQTDLWTDPGYLERREKLDEAVEEIRRRFGKAAIRSACLLGDLKMPDDGRDGVRMPGLMYR